MKIRKVARASVAAFSALFAFGCATATTEGDVSNTLDPNFRGYGALQQQTYELLIGATEPECRAALSAVQGSADNQTYLYDDDVFLRWNPVVPQQGRNGRTDQAWSNNPHLQSKYRRSVLYQRYDWIGLPIYNNNEFRALFRVRYSPPPNSNIGRYVDVHGVERNRAMTLFVIADKWQEFAATLPQSAVARLSRFGHKYPCIFGGFVDGPESAGCEDLLREYCADCQSEDQTSLARLYMGLDVEFEVMQDGARFYGFFRRSNFRNSYMFNGRAFKELINILEFKNPRSFDEKRLLGIPSDS